MNWEMVEKLGLPTAIVMGLAFSTWRIISFLGVKLFDDTTGLVTRVTNTHIDFVEGVKMSVQKQGDCVRELTTHSQKQLELTEDLHNIILEQRRSGIGNSGIHN